MMNPPVDPPMLIHDSAGTSQHRSTDTDAATINMLSGIHASSPGQALPDQELLDGNQQEFRDHQQPPSQFLGNDVHDVKRKLEEIFMYYA